jgi:hypothetical protein
VFRPSCRWTVSKPRLKLYADASIARETTLPNPIIVTVLLAFAGYAVTYFNNVRLEQRKAKLKFVSDQLQFLYGPLFSLNSASTEAWTAFRSRYRPGGAFFRADDPPSDDELKQWRLWMQEVFMPINLQMRKAIVENTHLVEGQDMPQSFRDLLAHVEVYKVTVKKWEANDFSEHTSYLNFPSDFGREVQATFEALKRRQAGLIGS